MTSFASFEKIRPEHEKMVSEWIAGDAVHVAAGISWKDVIADRTESYLVSDESGCPLEVVRLCTAMRVALQFGPNTYRVAKYAPNVMEWLQQKANERQAKEMIIRPGSPKVVHFVNRLGWSDFSGKVFEINADQTK